MKKFDKILIPISLLIGGINIIAAVTTRSLLSIVGFSIGIICICGAIAVWRKVNRTNMADKMKTEIFIGSAPNGTLDFEGRFKEDGNCDVCPDMGVPVNLVQPSGFIALYYSLKRPSWVCDKCWARYDKRWK